MDSAPGEPSRKRRRLDADNGEPLGSTQLPESATRSISPPPLRKQSAQMPQIVRSPFQLTWIRDLPTSSNVDAITLKDILGDPLIKECWEFNYMHDLDYLMEAFDSDVRDLVKVNVVHGFWKKDSESRLTLQSFHGVGKQTSTYHTVVKEQVKKYPNISLHTAYMPEMFGTHHTKMLVLIRHDSSAQIIIHTANMIAFDWTNMSQAVWKSPLLPELTRNSKPVESNKVGSGSRFKTDFINYLKAYDTKKTICKPLIEQISKFDFSEIRAALVASVPGTQSYESDAKTSWGWVGLQNALRTVPVQGKEPEIVVQISSIATLGANDKWLDGTLFKALAMSKNIGSLKPKFRIIFPTADEIRRSLNGYNSGSAVHTKTQSAAQAKQVQYLKPLFCHWAGDGAQHAVGNLSSLDENENVLTGLEASKPVKDAGRKRAAPHIKTYIRFANTQKASIDWMLVTSANLSKQAWGEAINKSGDVRICSYEIGVLVWPELFGEKAKMVPTFKTDTPLSEANANGQTVVGARMPYDLPLVPYAKDDMPWCASASYTEPDWMGETWKMG